MASTPLLGQVRPSLYRLNAYRLTGLPFNAGAGQIVAVLGAALVNPKPPMPPVPALTPAEIEAGAARRLDLQALLVDDFFWLWPRPTSKDGKDKALEALARGAWLDAIDFWRVQCQQRAHDGVALHNIAVLFHMMALDLESQGEVGAAGGRRAKERDVWWKEAFRAWHSLHGHAAFWHLYADRITGRLAGNSHLDFVESLRTHLLPAIATINGQLAAERCSGEEAWDRQIALIDATGYPAADTLQARRIAADPFARAIRAAISEAIGRTRNDTREGLTEAARILERARGWLPFLAKASLPTEGRSLSDEIAVAAMGCLDACGRATGRWADLLATAEAALSIAQSPDARARLNKQLVIFRTNYSTQVHRQREEELGALRNRCAAILSAKASGRERLSLLIQCAQDDLRELVTAGAGDQELEDQACGTVARAFHDLALALRQHDQPILLTLDALSVAESLARDADIRKQVSAERESIERGLRSLQHNELSDVDSPYPLLTEYASPELYAGNAFRLTGLSARATERELSRHVQKMEMAARLGAPPPAAAGPLSIGAPDVEATKTAVQRIHEVERRLLDEFFWLWPLPEYAVGGGVAASPVPLSEEQLTDAVDSWKAAASRGLDHGLCAHNLAVLYHLRALDFELRQRRTPLSADECAARDGSWTEAFLRWKEALGTTALWEEVAERIAGLADPRLGREAMVRLRSGLPVAVLSTALRLAVRVHDRDFGELKRLTQLVVSSGFEPESVRMAATPLVDRIRERLSTLSVDAAERAKQAPKQAHLVAQELMGLAWASLEALTHLLGEQDSVAAHSHDELALAAADCLLHFARETKDWPTVLKTLKQIEFLARGPSATETIQGYLNTVSANALFDRATAELDALANKLRTIVGGAVPAEDRVAQVRALIDASPPLANDPDYLSARGDLIAHWLQQLALRVNNEDEKYALALDLVQLGLTFCKDADIRQKLVDARKAVGRNAAAEAVQNRCRAILDAGASNAEKLRELGECAKSELQVVKTQHGSDGELLDLVSDSVAGAIRSTAIDLCNNEQKFTTALEWLRFAGSLARGADLRQRLGQDIVACQGLVQRFATASPPPAEGVPKQRGFLTSCANCKTGILMLSHRDAHGRIFCSKACLEWFNGPRGFCPKCIAETTDESAGGLSQVNGVGNSFMGSGDKCPVCGSVVCRKVVTAVWLPVFPQSRYRVLYSSPTSFYSRRMK